MSIFELVSTGNEQNALRGAVEGTLRADKYEQFMAIDARWRGLDINTDTGLFASA